MVYLNQATIEGPIALSHCVPSMGYSNVLDSVLPVVYFFEFLCRATSARYPNLTALYSIGKSIQGRDLWVMVVSSSPYEHMVGKPDVKYVGNIHGNEPVGREMLLHLIQYFVSSYNTDQYVKWLLDNTRIHILPTMNPDGYSVSKEGTCDGAQGR